jgi:hypothetical protein
MNIIKNILKNQYISTFISITILIYTVLLSNNLSNRKNNKHNLLKFYTKIFNHYLFRVMFLLLVLYFFNNETRISICLVIAFIMINISITNNMIKNSFGQFEHFLELEQFTVK